MSILVGIPSRDGRGDYVAMGFLFQEMARRGDVRWIPKADTILTSGHNQLWATALTWRKKQGLNYYINLHDDIRPAPDFITAMLKIMQDSKANVLGCSVAIKDERGLTSTCLSYRDKASDALYRRRITLREMQQLPQTFDVADVAKLYGKDPTKCYLGINTGLMLVDLSPDWVEKLYFTINDRIFQDATGDFCYHVEPEDWFFSRLVHEFGGRVVCTRAFEIQHLGVKRFSNLDLSGYEHDYDCGDPELAKLRPGLDIRANGSRVVQRTGSAAPVELRA